METDNTIPVDHLCQHYQADTTFFESLRDYGLVEIVEVEHMPSIATERIKTVETMIHLHYDLNINMEGLDAIAHLLSRIDQLKQELNQTKNQLKFFDTV